MITIVDYGLGNICAFANVFKQQNVDFAIAKSAEELRSASKIILPGVGAFDHAMERLERSGMRATLDYLVLDQGVPVLGVCVGMQMLAESSDEGKLPGLGWIKGRVRGFKTTLADRDLPLPHMGWNDVHPVPGHGLFHGLETEARFYFLHSFYLECAEETDVAAIANYGLKFHAAVSHRNIHGAQFHPEKSHHLGARFLKNYSDL
jgi:glutamine amidotransferase